jgi:hypothetical protein
VSMPWMNGLQAVRSTRMAGVRCARDRDDRDGRPPHPEPDPRARHQCGAVTEAVHDDGPPRAGVDTARASRVAPRPIARTRREEAS